MANYRAKEIIIIMIKQFANRRRVKRERGGGERLSSHTPLPPPPLLRIFRRIPVRVVRITHKAKDPPVISALHNNNDSRDNSSYILGGKSVSRGPGKQRREQNTYVYVYVYPLAY